MSRSLGEINLETNLKDQLEENEATCETVEKKTWVSKMAHGVTLTAAESNNQSSIPGCHMMTGGTNFHKLSSDLCEPVSCVHRHSKM